MKKYIILFLILLSGLNLWAVYSQYSRQESWRVRHMESEFGEPFIIPHMMNVEALSNYEKMYPLLLEVAEVFEANVFRSQQHLNHGINKFVLLTGETKFFDHITVINGRTLTIDETRGREHFLATHTTDDLNQVGQVTFFGNRANLRISPLLTAFSTLPVAGRYYVELPDEVEMDAFLTYLVTQINHEFGLELEVNDFLIGEEGGASLARAQTVDEIFVLAVLITVILAIYYVFAQTKKISILKLNGLCQKQIWSRVIGKLLHKVLGTMTLMTLLIGTFLAFYYQDFSFLFLLAIRQFSLYGFILLASLSVFKVIKRIPMSLGVKNKNDTSLIFKLNTILKAGLAVAILLIGFFTLNSYREIRVKEAGLSHWELSEDFGVFSFMGSAHEWNAIQSLRDEEEWRLVHELYPILNEMGGVLANFQSYRQIILQNLDLSYIDDVNSLEEDDFNLVQYSVQSGKGAIRVGKVNLNYLNLFPLLDTNGETIMFNEEDTEIIYLVPERYQIFEAELLEKFNWRTSLWELGHYRIEDEISKKELEIKIIWMQNDQSVFTFDPNLALKTNNKIIDPIIQVITESNSFAYERLSVLGQVSGDPMKVRLVDNDPIKTRELLAPLLQEIGLEENLGPIVSVNEAMINQIANLQSELNGLIMMAGMVFLVAIGLTLQNTILFFKRFERKFIINRVFGSHFFKTYKLYFHYFGKLWLIQLIGALGIALAFNLPIFGTLIVLFIGIEALLSMMMIFKLERKNKMAVLKGED